MGSLRELDSIMIEAKRQDELYWSGVLWIGRENDVGCPLQCTRLSFGDGNLVVSLSASHTDEAHQIGSTASLWYVRYKNDLTIGNSSNDLRRPHTSLVSYENGSRKARDRNHRDDPVYWRRTSSGVEICAWSKLSSYTKPQQT